MVTPPRADDARARGAVGDVRASASLQVIEVDPISVRTGGMEEGLVNDQTGIDQAPIGLGTSGAPVLDSSPLSASPGPTKNLPLPWSAEKDTWGQRAGTAPLCRRGTSLSWRGRRTAPRKTDGDVAAGPPPCRTSP
jgi:hypothetical protein